ncbi:hypothetical protein PoHVEF18_004921 [Penicillium ochrochloron]
MSSNNGHKEVAQGTVTRYQQTLETIYETSEEDSQMPPTRQVGSAKPLMRSRIPRAQRKPPQRKVVMSEETMVRRAILTELEEIDKHWENLAKLYATLLELMRKKRTQG